MDERSELSSRPGGSRPGGRENRRGRYLLDARLQFAFALPLVGVLVAVGVAYWTAIQLIPADVALRSMTGDETRRLLLRASGIYFGIAAIGVLSVALYLAHRIAGPAFVIERALRGMRSGDYAQRLTLRPQDQLKPLAAAALELREQLERDAARRGALLRELASRLDPADHAALQELLAELDDPQARAKAPVAADEA